MCKFKSGIVLLDEREKGGIRLLMSPWTESHSEIIQIHNIKEGIRLNIARVEFSPPSMATAHKSETYRLTIDEPRAPEWFDAEMKEAVAKKMRAYIASIIITGDGCLLIGGQFIVAPKAKIQVAKNAIITALIGGTVGEVLDGGKIANDFRKKP